MDTSARLGPIRLAPGVRPSHAVTYLFSAFFAIGIFTFLTQLQPLVLQANLGIAQDRQGAMTGTLAFVAELVAIATIGLWGSLSDRIGRRPVYIVGFLLLGLGYAAYGFADDPWQLALYRAIAALGGAAVSGMLATVLADYAANESRGVMTGITYVLNGLGVLLFLFGLVKLPAVLVARGVDEIWAGRWALLLVAGICLVCALAMLGLRRGSGAGGDAAGAPRESLLQLMKAGLGAMRHRRIALAYGTSFASRGDLVVVGTFITLWGVQAAQQQGASLVAATAKAGALIGVVQAAALVWAMVFGWLCDRLDRITAVAVAMGLATLGYGAMGLQDDPLATAALPWAALLGVGQMSAILASQVLVAQEAPAEVRGSVLGAYGIFGAIGILFISLVGGWLFDAWTPAAPCLVMAACNAVLLAWAIIERVLAPQPDPAAPCPSSA